MSGRKFGDIVGGKQQCFLLFQFFLRVILFDLAGPFAGEFSLANDVSLVVLLGNAQRIDD